MRNDRKTGSRKLEVGSGEVPTSQPLLPTSALLSCPYPEAR